MVKKGQIALEFLILVVVLLAFTAGIMVVVSTKIVEVTNIREDRIKQDIVDSISREVDLAHTAMDGYTRVFSISQGRLDSVQSTIMIQASEVVILNEKSNFTRGIQNVTVIDNLHPGENILVKQNGQVLLNP
ncbi:hypothetical protein K9M79_04025 [Candidatus Woesearchaeota archaeon]|nr:hypothetical protein [Candidatus Woesearchaeota archaeon]